MVVFTRLKSFYRSITNSIAFYPMLYAFAAIVAGMSMNLLEDSTVTDWIRKQAPQLLVNDVETARGLVTTLVAGAISMLVFSFSMVMLLLSQAASNYSPRVLPSLVSERRHQRVLGIFLATILYNAIIMISIDPNGKDYQLPGFSVLMGTLLSIISLGMFVYFIHSISSSIQINNIMDNIHTLSRKRIQYLTEIQVSDYELPDSSKWDTYSVEHSGTLQNISHNALKEYALENDLKFDILIPKGKHVLASTDLYRCSGRLDKDAQATVLKNFKFIESELVGDNYLLGFKQLTEIGIKAMSPGVNDPGTAIDSIHFLTDLFAMRMMKHDGEVIVDDNHNVIINSRAITFQELIYTVLASYRNYSKQDFTVMFTLLEMTNNLMEAQSVNQGYYDSILQQSELLIEDARKHIDNSHDLQLLEDLHEK
ncbi:MAG: DUF2254 domain-containing protein [Nonlabens sp.]